MVIVDTSVWIEYFRGGLPRIVEKVDQSLTQDLVGIGDLVFCEIMQGVRSPRERREVSDLLLSLPQFDMVGFNIAQKSALIDFFHNTRQTTSEATWSHPTSPFLTKTPMES